MYLILNDYKSYIQPVYLNQLTQTDDSKRLTCEMEALALIKGKLQQKYDVSSEFTNTSVWDYTKTYAARDRVYLDYPLWVANTAYQPNSLVTYQGVCYICRITNSGAIFDYSKWDVLGNQYDMFYAAFPSTCTYPATLAEPLKPIFSLYGNYKVGDVIFWKNYTYVCAKSSEDISPVDLITYYKYENIPYSNVFPDSADNATRKYWASPTKYVITAGTLPTNLGRWVKGDNRDPQIMLCMKYVVIYLLAPLLAPNNIPDIWNDNYKMACTIIDQMGRGIITADMQLLNPYQGKMTSYGGNVKNQNHY